MVLKKLEKLDILEEELKKVNTRLDKLETGQEKIKAQQVEAGNTVTMAYESLQHATEDRKSLLLLGQEEIKKTVMSHKKYIK